MWQLQRALRAAGRTHCSPALELGISHSSSQDPALSRAPVHTQPLSLGRSKHREEGTTRGIPCRDTQAAVLCSDSTISHGISPQGIVQPSARAWLAFSSLPRCHRVPATHARPACL